MSLPPRMRAAYITAHGPAEAITVGELPVPPVGPADVLVAVRVAAVNPVDTFVRSGAYATPVPFPFVIGRDLAGEVVAAGAGVLSFTPGDRVCATVWGTRDVRARSPNTRRFRRTGYTGCPRASAWNRPWP